ncbi:alpha/beta fold hydrolase [Kribbella sp. NPDC049227]|uniref:alpha/beta fold hydrolase n=1 Tax=Kribbella sp. NPDC049227 TaxID=3364113 RepID=UPI00371F4D37
MNRRTFIAGTGVALAGAAGTATPAAATDDQQNFLFVHGAWHSSAHWNDVAERLTAMGHRAFAIDLPGSGLNAAYPQSYLSNDFAAFATEPSPIANIGLADYVKAVTDQVEKMAEHGKVTLVGHSMGGLTITRVAEAVPHLLRRLVYLSAYVPVNFASANDYSQLPENQTGISGAIVVADPVATGAVRINPRNGDPEYVERGRQALYNDLTTDDYLRFAVAFNPDLPVRVGIEDARGSAQRWGKVPRLFIRTTEDHTVPPALQDRMIREADAATPRNKFVVRTLPSSHSPFASMPDRLVKALVQR